MFIVSDRCLMWHFIEWCHIPTKPLLCLQDHKVKKKKNPKTVLIYIMVLFWTVSNIPEIVITSYIHNIWHTGCVVQSVFDYSGILQIPWRSQGHVVSIANQLQAGWSGLQIPVGVRDFSHLHNVHPGTWVIPVGKAELYLYFHQYAFMA